MRKRYIMDKYHRICRLNQSMNFSLCLNVLDVLAQFFGYFKAKMVSEK